VGAKARKTTGRGDRTPGRAADLQRQDAARWRAFAAEAGEFFAEGVAWARSQEDPLPAIFEGAEGWSTTGLNAASIKGRLALQRGDVVAALLALVEAGRFSRDGEIVRRIVGSVERAITTQARHAACSRPSVDSAAVMATYRAFLAAGEARKNARLDTCKAHGIGRAQFYRCQKAEKRVS
jgi:hypothetical protein